MMKHTKRTLTSPTFTRLTAALALALIAGGAGQAQAQTCPETSDPVTYTGSTLEPAVGNGDGGLTWNTTDEVIEIRRIGGDFQATPFDMPGAPVHSCAADFDGDGWQDIAWADKTAKAVGVSLNKTNPLINANYPDPVFVSPSDASPTAQYRKYIYAVNPWDTSGVYADPPAGSPQRGGMACGDFNGDTRPDIALIYANNTGSVVWHRMLINDGTAFFPAITRYAFVTNATTLGYLNGFIGDNTTMDAYDYNLDGKLDIVWAGKSGANSVVRVFLNGGNTASGTYGALSSKPLFNTSSLLLSVAGGGFGGVDLAKINGDSVIDLVTTQPGAATNKAVYWPGLSTGLFSTTPGVMTGGNSTPEVPVAADFDLNGRIDVMTVAAVPPRIDFWSNSGAPSYVAHARTSELSVPSAVLNHAYSALVVDYDNDPDHTPDFIMGDAPGGSATSTDMVVFRNDVQVDALGCGTAISGVFDLGALADENIVITSARIKPEIDVQAPATISFYLSNVDPPVWVLATPCADDNSYLCASFDSPVGRYVRWKAYMCANGSTESPTITNVEMTVGYIAAEQHFRGGVVVHNGVAYMGAFENPGDSGHLYAIDTALSSTYWDAGETIQAMTDGSRKIYTSNVAGDTRVAFSTLIPSTLTAPLGAGSTAQVIEIVNWFRGDRFGFGGTTQRFGGVLTSTPAVVGPPPKPWWYDIALGDAKAAFDLYRNTPAIAARTPLVLVGSKDGALHALVAGAGGTGGEGSEAWAFIPREVASRLLSDMTADQVSAYPDGSPSIDDVRFADGTYHTIAVVGGGRGMRSFIALDISNSATTGPTPLWSYSPGGAYAGDAESKAAVVRTRVGANDKFQVVMATGFSDDNSTPPFDYGIYVEAVDAQTGERIWRFQTACPVTTDVSGYETNDEPNAVIDGYVDRLIFADSCGNIYKVDPKATPDADDWIEGMGTIDTGADGTNGDNIMALFSTDLTPGTLGEARPVAGTLGVRPDAEGRTMIYAGTGGLESYDPANLNDFYVIGADNGAVVERVAGVAGDCVDGRCPKFYGGVVVTPSQLLVTRTLDAPAASGLCVDGESRVLAFDIETMDALPPVFQDSAIVSSLFGDGGAIYATTLSGSVVRVGTPTASTGVPVGGGGTEGNTTITQRRWRQVL